ncbi:hypothetical protein [Nostoc sp. NZL]|uniref:hypothetical protein n=1 Tax=Nostoc sp. NZL TaxID=2650612 RepID=UPI0018C4DF91|nr:hypothetical protein [Nostoc sp. NZL]MBG1242114.1 hypothetical protein [Nostoc sp. NZL]
MKLPIQAQPVTRKIGTTRILHSILVQTLSLDPCSPSGKMCGGFVGVKCCPGGECKFSPGSDFGYCYGGIEP